MLTKSQKRNAKRKRAKLRNKSLANSVIVIPDAIYLDKHFYRHIRTLEYIISDIFGATPVVSKGFSDEEISQLVKPRYFSFLTNHSDLPDSAHELWESCRNAEQHILSLRDAIPHYYPTEARDMEGWTLQDEEWNVINIIVVSQSTI